MSAIATFNKCRFMLANHTLTAQSVAVTPAPVAGYEAVNLQDPARTKVCKVLGATMEIKIQMTGNPWTMGLFATGFDYPVTTKLRHLINDVDVWSGALKYDSGDLPAYPSALAADAGLAGQYTAGGYLTPDVAPYHRNILSNYYDLKTEAWHRITITAPAGTASISIGVLGLCFVYEMTRNFSNDWSIEPVDTTVLNETTNGDLMPGRQGTRYGLLKLKFKNIPAQEAWYIKNELDTLGYTPLFIDAFPGDGVHSAWTRLYGRVVKISGLRRSKAFNCFDFDIIFREQT